MTTSAPTDAIDRECMTRAIAAAARVRCITTPNPWVGAVLRTSGGDMYEGATQEPGQPHAEVEALRAAGTAAAGATLYVTLEPCSHTGRTGPCVEAIIEAGVSRVVVGIEDPDPQVAGSGLAALGAAGIEVTLGVQARKVRTQLAPYLKHRTTGRPWVVLKLARPSTVGPLRRTARASGSPRRARVDGHRLRAESMRSVGAGTVSRRPVADGA
jgi:diaminohydroxyphosphoribosylaminopyrimidine deaminase/5-amino-6-(5-phosphoribosylamino)uracil reductase